MAEKVVVDFDQHSKEYRERGMEIAAEIRAKCPVTWVENYGGHWLVTALDEASAMYKRPDLFSAVKDVNDPEGPFQGIQIPNSAPFVQSGFLEMDPPRQLEYRRILNSYLSPSGVEKWRPLVEDFTHACIDEVIEQGRADFVEEIVNVVPAILTLAMIGLPLEDWRVYCEPAHAGIYTPPDSPDRPRVDQMSMDMMNNLFGAIASAHEKSRPGLLQALLEARIDDEPLSDMDILFTLFLIIGGGFDTTTALTSSSWRWLAENPAERARLLSGDAALWNTATEEFLRYFTPAQGDARTVTQDCEVAGFRFAKHDRVLISFAIPNRDPKYFEDPDVLKLDRFPNRHAAFGLGNHRCLGSNLARMQFKTIMQGALERIPEYTIDYDGTERYETIGIINGYRSMPFTFTPGNRRGPGLQATIEAWQQRLDDEAAAAGRDPNQ
ncbi:MAG: cytochrome P450 [Acidobacteriota bacterium]|nr:cytochrome P450 [Acidobacteriota bacterium]